VELLRQANAAQVQAVQAAGGGPVLTVRRAVAMLGLDGVRAAAAGLRAWPGPLGEADAAALQRAIGQARLAGHVAQRLRPAGYDAEVVFLLAVLQNLGRLLLHYHFPEDAQQIARLMHPAPTATGEAVPGLDEPAAACAVLGVDLEAMTAAVARHWGLDGDALHMLRRLPPDRPVRPAESDGDLLRASASAANEAVDALVQLPPGRLAAALDLIARRYARVLGLGARELHDAVHAARAAAERGAGDAADGAPPEPFTDALPARTGT
jgi:non-specific serine/threonine protein kinase